MADGAHGDTGVYVCMLTVVQTRDGESAGAPAQILLRQVVGRNVPDTTEKEGLVALQYHHAKVSHSMATNRHPG